MKRHFKGGAVFETQDIIVLYEQIEKNIKQTAVNWRVHTLVQSDVLQRIGRGKFTLGKGKNWISEVSPTIKSVFKKLKAEFPKAILCVWNPPVLNKFMHHQPNRFFVLVETDRETTNSVFYFLREKKVETINELNCIH